MFYSLYRCYRFSHRPIQIYRSVIVRWIPVKHYSENGVSDSPPFKTFNDMISFRRLQAAKSVLVGVNSDTYIEEVLEVCERFGIPTTKVVFHPGNSSEHQLVCLVEYKSLEEVQRLLENCEHVVGNGCTPVFSRLLCHRPSSGRKKGSSSLTRLQEQGRIQYVQPHTKAEMVQQLTDCQNAKEQLDVLYREERLPDLGSRLRFLLCRQLEDGLGGLLPHCRALPFGSSVNGFGKFNCDLDISVDLTHSVGSGQGLTFQPPGRPTANERFRTQMTLDVLGDLIQNFFPCVSSVQKILRARVPILKIHHTITGLDSDISVSNSTGVCMSELLFLLGEVDPRVRPLVFAVRRWAWNIRLTHNTSGQWITNFSLTLMVIFFLQTRTPPVLPTLRQLKDLAGAEDVQTVDGVDCTFRKDSTAVPKSQNTEDIDCLLADFFWFLADMKWDENGLSLVTGEVVRKPDARPLFIQNPLETHLNVCSIVTQREAEKFVSAVKEVLWELESNSRGQEPFRFLQHNRGDQLRRSRGLLISQLFEKGPATVPKNTPQHSSNTNVDKREDKTSKLSSGDLNSELLMLQDSIRSEKKKVRGKSSQRSSKLFSSADLWKLL